MEVLLITVSRIQLAPSDPCMLRQKDKTAPCHIVEIVFTQLICYGQVTFRGDGILGGVQAIAEATGQVKGKVGNPEADPPLQPSGKLDVGGAVGKGNQPCVRSMSTWGILSYRYPGIKGPHEYLLFLSSKGHNSCSVSALLFQECLNKLLYTGLRN